MSRTWKQILCTILIPVMLLGVFPVIGIDTSTEAEAASQITTDEVTKKIDVIWEQIGNKYWCGGYGEEYLKKCADSGDYNKAVSDKSGNTNEYHGKTCHSFAAWIEYCIFKVGYAMLDKKNFEQCYSIPDDYTLKPGDILNIDGTGIASHWAVVWKVDIQKKEITIIEANSPKAHIINTRTLSFKSIIEDINDTNIGSNGQTCFYKCPAIAHTHEYDKATGKCTKDKNGTICGYDYYQDNKNAVSGTVTPKTGESFFYVYKKPYVDSGRVKVNGKDLKVKSATLVSCGENFYEGNDHIWYEIKVPGYNGVCYVNSNRCTTGIKHGFTFDYVPKDFPKSKTIGQSGINIKDTKITSTSDANLKCVTAEILDYETKEVEFTKTQEHINSKSWTFDQDMDTAMGFSKITTPGNYIYRITAKDVNGFSEYKEKVVSITKKGESVQPVHEVTFDANGGYNAPAPQQVVSGQSVDLNVKEPTWFGYKFKGWVKDAWNSITEVFKGTASYSAKTTASMSGPEEGKLTASLASGGFVPTEDTKLYALWERIPVPSAPTMTNMTYNIGLGRTVNVSWNSSDYANSYIASVYASNGTEIQSLRQELNGTFTTFMFDSVGTYTIRVRAKNIMGEESGNSQNCITAVVHPSSTVTFKNYDGTTLATHEVVYGDSTTQPNSPTRTGYDFIGWSGSFLNVTENRTITAQYKPKDYTVTFYDCDGDALPVQTVHYSSDTPGSAAEPAVSQLAVPHGYTFVGWDSNEWTSVTRTGIEVRPVYVWTNDAVPISSVINSVTAAGQGYWVDYTITNHVNEARLGRVVILAKNQYGKFICQTESGAFYMTGINDSISSRIYVYVNEKDETKKAEMFSSITTVELLVVDSYEEMIPIAEPVTRYTPDRESKLWSDWMTKAEYNAIDNTSYTNYETKTQYRVSRREEKTSNYPNMDGYSRLDSRTTSYKGEWSNWSGWSTTPVYASANVDVETRTVTLSNAYTEYSYGTLMNKFGNHDPQNGSGNYNRIYYTPWSTTRYNIVNDTVIGYSTPGKDGFYTDIYGNPTYYTTSPIYRWHIYYAPGTHSEKKTNQYYWEVSRTIPAQTQIQYRYRTRSDIYVYTFERWSGYGSWSDTYTASDGNTQVQTQKLYRVCMKAVTPKEGAYEYTVNVPEAAGKQAIFSVYKVDQASDYSNEYMEQVTLDADGKHTFVFDTLKECTADTGDFTMTLTIEGSSNPLYVGTILAPRKEYTVNFIDMDGSYICEPQTVQEGYAVTAPEAPYHEGYVFLGWEYGLTNIRDDMDIHARYIPKEYVVVYLDWLNGTANMLTGITYGSKLELPEPEAPEGYTFIGWKTPKGLSADSVSDNMIVTAEFEQQVVNVTFTDANGEAIDESEVPYGELPVDPLTDFYLSEDTESEEDGELLTSLNGLSYDPGDDTDEEEYTIESILSVPEGMYFAGWAEAAYCPATQELVLTPTLEYNESAEEATVSLESGVYYGTQTLEISCENENTEFTYSYVSIEGEDSTESSIEYTGPITVDRSCVIKVSTTEEGKGSTETKLEYTILPADSKPAAPQNVSVSESVDGAALTWNAVDSAQGYYISKTDELGNEETFMSDTNSYTDTNVRELCEYVYSVTAYSKYETEYAELLLESDGSAEVKIKYFGNCTPVETVTIQNAPERMYDGSTVQLNAVVTPDNAYDSNVVWLTDSECLYVTEEGLLMASGSGTGTVTALAADGSGASDTKQVVVEIPESGGATLTVSSAELVRDNPSELTVLLSENRGVAAMQFAVLYDSTQIELVSCAEGSALSGKSPTINSTIPGVIYFNWDGLEPLYSGGELLKLSFSAKSGISRAQLSVEIPTESDEYEFVFSDSSHNPVPAVAVNGLLSVSEFKLGDVNSDGNINIIDANIIRRFAARFSDVEMNEIQRLNADVNGDGKINVLDASLIRRYAAKLIEEFPNAG